MDLVVLFFSNFYMDKVWIMVSIRYAKRCYKGIAGWDNGMNKGTDKRYEYELYRI